MKRSHVSRNFLRSFEIMENRDCPAVMCAASAGSLMIHGDQSSNVIDVSTSSSGVIDVVGDGAAFHFTGIKSVQILTGDGDDTVNLRVDEATNKVCFKAAVDLGGGNDALNLQVLASQGFAASTGVNTNTIDVTAKGSIGADRLSAAINSTGGTPAMLVPAVKLAFDGGAGDDTLSMAMNGIILRGTTTVNFTGGDGADTITQDLHFNNLMAATNLSYFGGAGDDRIDTFFDASGLRSVYNAPVNLNVQGNAGNDTINFKLGGSTTPSSTGENRGDPFNPVVNVTLNFSLDGGDGNDVISASAAVAPQGPGQVNARILGGLGDDDLTLDVSAVPANKLASAAIDGGEGTDTAHAAGNVTLFNTEL